MITFQEIVQRLHVFWAKQGCIICQPYDIEKGASTFNPSTFLRCLGPEPYKAACIEPCRRPKDGRYGTNPNRLQHYFQYQVILKPSPYNIQDLYLQSLQAIGLELSNHDIRFVHDDWESPTLGAWGLGWEVWIDGQECTQFTYFQSVAGIPLQPITGEITYGIERIAMYLQNVDSIFDIQWNDTLTYGDLYLPSEIEWSRYNFEVSDSKMWFAHFEDYEKEAKRLVELRLPLPAYDFVIKASHAFNMLDARGVISVSERANYIASIRALARTVADGYLASREAQGFPLLKKHNADPLPALKSLPPLPQIDTPQDFLLEIGCEELPASFVSIGCQHLEQNLKKFLQAERIAFSSCKVMGTPRRLAALVRHMALYTAEQLIEKRGPSCAHAYHDDGSLKSAGEGFFKQLGKAALSRSQVELGQDPEIRIATLKGVDYLFHQKKEMATPSAALLQKALPKLILGIDFPKEMRWGNLDITFARPIRWIVALFGSAVIPVYVGPIASGNVSYGHRQLSGGPMVITQASDYERVLQEHFVLVDIQERRASIEKQLRHIEHEGQCHVLEKERVINQVVHLVEYPFLTKAEFNRNFLRAPQEVLISEMIEHQKYFPVADKDGTLINEFIITANMSPTDSIRRGNKKVISARLADGVFLFEQDAKMPLVAYNKKLEGIVFYKGLGTVMDKVERLRCEAQVIATYFPQANTEWVQEAALLSKADLATEMVGEFPELQGQMGRIYAQYEKKPEEVAMALDEQWMPRGENGALPVTTTGTILSLADKLDNLLGFFAIDAKPTSSSDPYGLRRQGLAIVRILINAKVHLPLPEVLSLCCNAFPEAIRKDTALLIDAIIDFLKIRAKTVLHEAHFPKGEIDAVMMSLTSFDCYDLYLRLSALHHFRKEYATFTQLIEVHKRCQGQTTGMPQFVTHPELLTEKAEKELFQAILERKPAFSTACLQHDYTQAFSLLAELQPYIATLFDTVKILADDQKIQHNRIALLQEVLALFAALADFQKIQE